MLGVARGERLRASSTTPSDAEVIVVNTCGFIGEAKKESIDTIFEMAELQGARRAARSSSSPGCLSQRYPDELAARDARGRSLPRLERHAQARRRSSRGDAERMLVGNPADWVDPRDRSARRRHGRARART